MWNTEIISEICKKSYLIITLLIVLIYPSLSSSAEIITVQSINITPYNNAVQGVKKTCGCNAKRFVLSEMKEEDIIQRVREAKPTVIAAVGIDALSRLGVIQDIPVVYLMVPNPRAVTSGGKNITGVSMYISPGKQLSVFQHVMPDVKKIGLLYDPARMGDFVRQARGEAEAAGITLVTGEVKRSRDVPALLESMTGEIHAFWMLPDITVITPETVEYLFLLSLEKGMPVIAFSDKYLEMGALMSLGIDAYDIGNQAGKIIKRILSGTDIRSISETSARKIDITINRRVAKKLGIRLSESIPDKARVID